MGAAEKTIDTLNPLNVAEPVFSNRVAEIQTMEDFIARDGEPLATSCLILTASRSSGVTRLLEHLAEEMADRSSPYRLDAQVNEFEPVPKRLADAARSAHRAGWARYEGKKTFTDSLLVGISIGVAFIPIIGNGLSKAIDRLFAPRLSRIANSSDTEKLQKLLRKQSETAPPFVLIDNAQRLNLKDLEYFRSLAFDGNIRIKIVLAIVDDDQQSTLSADEVMKRLTAIGVTTEVMPFEKPDADFIASFCKANGALEMAARASELSTVVAGDIYRLVALLQQPHDETEDNSNERMLMARLVCYLSVTGATLSSHELKRLSSIDDTIVCTDDDVERALHTLVRTKTIGQTYSLHGEPQYQLQATSSQFVRETLGDNRSVLVASEHVYRYFLNTPRPTMRTKLITYRCAKTVDPRQVPKHAQGIVEATLRAEDVNVASNFLETTFAPEQIKSLDDYVVSVGARISLKRYQDALDLIDTAPVSQWRSRRICQAMQVVALNRTRHHEDSIALANKLLVDAEIPEERAILASFKISGLMHEGRRSEALSTFREFRFNLKSAENYGYFLRNGSSALGHEEAISALGQAQKRFRTQGDEFGFWTADVGIASRLAVQGILSTALDRYLAAKDSIAAFGLHHLEEALSNVAFTQMLLEQNDNARLNFTHLLSFADDNVPKMYALGHLAYLSAVAGDGRARDSYLEQAATATEQCVISAHRARSFANLGLVAALIDDRSAVVTSDRHVR